MGLSCLRPPVDPEVEKILQNVTIKSEDIIIKKGKKIDKIKQKQEKEFKERAEDLRAAENKSKDEIKEILKKHNEIELKFEKELIANELDKLHSFWEIGLELSEPLKKVTLENLKKKIEKAMSQLKEGLNNQMKEIENYSPKQFLESKYGRPLKQALVKQGLSKTLLESFKKNLLEERNKRRKEERNTFSYLKDIEINEEDFEFKIDDLFEAVFGEYEEAFMPKMMKDFLKMEENLEDLEQDDD